MKAFINETKNIIYLFQRLSMGQDRWYASFHDLANWGEIFASDHFSPSSLDIDSCLVKERCLQGRDVEAVWCGFATKLHLTLQGLGAAWSGCCNLEGTVRSQKTTSEAKLDEDQINPVNNLCEYVWSQICVNERGCVSVWKAASAASAWRGESNHCITATVN